MWKYFLVSKWTKILSLKLQLELSRLLFSVLLISFKSFYSYSWFLFRKCVVFKLHLLLTLNVETLITKRCETWIFSYNYNLLGDYFHFRGTIEQKSNCISLLVWLSGKPLPKICTPTSWGDGGLLFLGTLSISPYIWAFDWKCL